MARYRFWIHDKDRKGRPIDKVILQTAEEIASTLTQYRQDEIGCDSKSNDLLQSAVEAASNAMQDRQIENPHGYLASSYRRIVDKFLNRERKLVPVDDEFLEDLANAQPTSSFEDRIHTQMVLDKLLQSMDPETRQIYTWRLEGYSDKEIAKLMATTPNAISIRCTRGFEKVKGRSERNRGQNGKMMPKMVQRKDRAS